MCVSVVIVTRFTKQQNNTQSRMGSRNLCTKYELHSPSNSRVMSVCFCWHGNKVYKAYTISYWPSDYSKLALMVFLGVVKTFLDL